MDLAHDDTPIPREREVIPFVGGNRPAENKAPRKIIMDPRKNDDRRATFFEPGDKRQRTD